MIGLELEDEISDVYILTEISDVEEEEEDVQKMNICLSCLEDDFSVESLGAFFVKEKSSVFFQLFFDGSFAIAISCVCA